MNCLRCGREVEEGHAFCDGCLESMKQYPVRPGTAVMLPKRKESPAVKKTKRNMPPTPADQIRKLKKQRNRLVWTAVVLAFLLIGTLILSSRLVPADHLRPGQNYSVAETTAAATEPAAQTEGEPAA